MVYCSVQYVVAIDIKGNKIEDQVNQTAPFYQVDLMKQKIKFTLKVSGIMINAKLKIKAVTIDSVILVFLRNLSRWSKISVFCSTGFIAIIA